MGYYSVAIAVLPLLLFAFLYSKANVPGKKKSQGPELRIKQLYIHPVKGLRPIPVESATISFRGFEHDRTFSLQRVHRDPDTKAIIKLEALLIGYQLTLALFATYLDTRDEESLDGAKVVITWMPETIPPKSLSWTGSSDQICFPLVPETKDLTKVDVNLHGSCTTAYDMGLALNNWFSERIGYEVILVYIGSNSRTVYGSMAPSSKLALSRSPSVTNKLLSKIPSSLPVISPQQERIAFNDLGQYLIVTQSSNDELSSRLAPGSPPMDVTKFRPNVVLSGSVPAFDEDFWAELIFNTTTQSREDRNESKKIKMKLTANCFRCQSITLDYKTGKTAEGEVGTVWKKLNRDRRVDKGAKWSPVFGRYGFCGVRDQGVILRVGDTVRVAGRNRERTVFDWPGLTTFGVSK